MVVGEEKTAQRHVVRIEFNAEDWEDIKRGINRLYADKMIAKPTAYRYLKWCGLVVSYELEKNRGGNNS
jgi:hypothetical protein